MEEALRSSKIEMNETSLPWQSQVIACLPRFIARRPFQTFSSTRSFFDQHPQDKYLLISSPSKDCTPTLENWRCRNPIRRSLTTSSNSGMELPTIMEEDLRTFHLKHFPTTPLPQSFTSAQEIDQEQEEELGYYPDGTKRTLTDDQIAMFRHSEIQQLIKMLRSQRTTSSQDSRSVDDVGTASTVDATQTSSKQNRDTKDSKKWLVSELLRVLVSGSILVREPQQERIMEHRANLGRQRSESVPIKQLDHPSMECDTTLKTTLKKAMNAHTAENAEKRMNKKRKLLFWTTELYV